MGVAKFYGNCSTKYFKIRHVVDASLTSNPQICCTVYIFDFNLLRPRMTESPIVSVDQKVAQEERLSKKHIQTLGYAQELMKENKKLNKLLDEYEQQKLHCDELHAQNEAVRPYQYVFIFYLIAAMYVVLTL